MAEARAKRDEGDYLPAEKYGNLGIEDFYTLWTTDTAVARLRTLYL